MIALMNAQTNNSPARASLHGAGRLAPPGFDMLMRLAIFMLIAWAFSLYGNELGGKYDENIQNSVFWSLAGLAVLWRLIIKRRQATVEPAPEPNRGESSGTESRGTDPGEQLSQTARVQLTREAKAAAIWLDVWRLLWWLAVLMVLVYATQLFIDLVLLYAAWRGLIGAMKLYRRRIWARAAKRGAASAAGTFRPVYWFERFILSWLLLPARLGMFALGLLWRYAGQAIGDAVLLAVLWCMAILAAGILAN